MRVRDLPLRWILLAAIVVPFGVHRIRLSMRSTEESIRARIEFLTDSIEQRESRRIRRALPRDFVDESSQYSRRDIASATRYLAVGSTRYRATLDPDDGLEFLSPPDDGAKAVTVRIHCLIESRERETEFEPWWDVTFTADLEIRDGSWMIVATRDVNHDERPRSY